MNNCEQHIINEARKRHLKAQEHYLEFSKNVSLVCRAVAFAEGGVFWLLKDSLPVNVLWVLWFGLLLLVLFFVGDFLQYYRGTTDYEKFILRMEDAIENGTITKEMTSNKKAKQFSDFYFDLKTYLIAFSSIFLMICFCYSNLSPIRFD